MKGVDTIARIRREYFVLGKSIKEIVREQHVSRNTVRKILRSGASEFTYERDVQPLCRAKIRTRKSCHSRGRSATDLHRWRFGSCRNHDRRGPTMSSSLRGDPDDRIVDGSVEAGSAGPRTASGS
jgi:hypothetical protein